MGNSGSFKKGHRETSETKQKRSVSLQEAWKSRDDYHGMYHTRFYTSWRSMVTRCRGTAGPDSVRKYKNKGITVCEKWQNFKGFYEDMYSSYQEGLTIDRIDNSKGYYQENCRWATLKQQANNTSKTVYIEYMGMRKNLMDWAVYFGINLNGLKIRYHHKYRKGLISIERLFTPMKHNKNTIR